MKSSKYKAALIVGLLLLLTYPTLKLKAQPTPPPFPSETTQPALQSTPDTLSKQKPQKGTPEYYEHKVLAYNRFWQGLIPNQARFQYAGNVGMFNLGLGWHYGGPQRHRWETDFMFGYLPRRHNPKNYLTFTLRQSYVPFRIPLAWNTSIEPLSTGLMLNAISGEEFWIREPSKYPHKYYGFPSAIRAHIFVGQRIRWEIPKAKRKYVKAISLCYELSACDLNIVSYATNSYIPLHDILSLSIGVKVDAF